MLVLGRAFEWLQSVLFLFRAPSLCSWPNCHNAMQTERVFSWRFCHFYYSDMSFFCFPMDCGFVVLLVPKIIFILILKYMLRFLLWQNIHGIKFTTSVTSKCTVQRHHAHSGVCSPHHRPPPERLRLPEQNSAAIGEGLPLSPSELWANAILFLSP